MKTIAKAIIGILFILISTEASFGESYLTGSNERVEVLVKVRDGKLIKEIAYRVGNTDDFCGQTLTLINFVSGVEEGVWKSSDGRFYNIVLGERKGNGYVEDLLIELELDSKKNTIPRKKGVFALRSDNQLIPVARLKKIVDEKTKGAAYYISGDTATFNNKTLTLTQFVNDVWIWKGSDNKHYSVRNEELKGKPIYVVTELKK